MSAWLARTKNQSLNTEMKCHWKNGKMRLFHSGQSKLISKDLFAHRLTETFIIFWWLMRFFVFWLYTQLRTLELKLLFLAARNEHIPLLFFSLLYTTGALLSLPVLYNSINFEFIYWTKGLGIIFRPRTAHPLWTKNKIEKQNQHMALYWWNFLNDVGNNWSSLVLKFDFAYNTSANFTTGKTPYEIVFGTKPQLPMSKKLGL